jgi:C4-type Zn-finger protein
MTYYRPEYTFYRMTCPWCGHEWNYHELRPSIDQQTAAVTYQGSICPACGHDGYHTAPYVAE